MSEARQQYEGWAIVELFGHSRIAGMISEQAIGGASFLRVDIPALNGVQAFTKFYGGGAVYAITPCDEETAVQVATTLQARPVEIWVAKSWQRALPDSDNYDSRTLSDDDDVPY